MNNGFSDTGGATSHDCSFIGQSHFSSFHNHRIGSFAILQSASPSLHFYLESKAGEVAPCIVRMMPMRRVHLRNVDLNLLLPLQALLQERNVTRAGRRVNLSQSAMSRALERLRELLGDDLLIRAGGEYQLTARGNALLPELEVLLTRLEEMMTGDLFTPGTTTARVRVAMTDYAAAVLLPKLVAKLSRAAPGLHIEVFPWHDRSYEALTDGTVDLVFTPLATPPEFHIAQLFEETFVCLLARQHACKRQSLSLREYLKFGHISIETQPHQQNLIDRCLAEAGVRRHTLLHLPYITPAVLALENTELVLTTPFRIAADMLRRYRIRSASAPPEIARFRYSMAWHPRLDKEALHGWFRDFVRQSLIDKPL